MIRKREINKNVVLIISIIVILFIGYGILEFYEGRREAALKKTQISEKLLAEKRYQNLEIKNINITDINNTISLSAQIRNRTEQDYTGENVSLVFLTEKGKVLEKVSTDFPSVEAGETSNIYLKIDKKCKEAYTFVIEK